MNKFKRLTIGIIIGEVLLILLANVFFSHQYYNKEGRMYLVEAKRLVREIQHKNLKTSEIEKLNLDKYELLVDISEFIASEKCSNDYLVEEINGKLYRIEYVEDTNNNLFIAINIFLICMMTLTNIVLFYIHKKVLIPFWNMSNLSYELAKGNLSMPIKEEKSRFLGHFLWGMNMLREKLEDNKEKELEFQKERKTLILSLSHDIKTPLSSIELYSKALEADLYDTEEKRKDALKGIIRNVKEIKGYVDEIVTASREDFLNLEVIIEEFYLSEVIHSIENFYKDKLSVIHTEFEVGDFSECLVIGDKNRLIEVIQNIMENAIKYGDGKYITISLDEEEDCKLIIIKNTGSHLKKEELPNLLDSFYRGSNSNGIKGSGLGLYICKNLMRKMDGDIFVDIEKDIFTATVVVRKTH